MLPAETCSQGGSECVATEVDEGEPFLRVDGTEVASAGGHNCRIGRCFVTGSALLLGAVLVIALFVGHWGIFLRDDPRDGDLSASATASAPASHHPVQSNSPEVVAFPATAAPEEAVSLQGTVAPVSCAAFGCVAYNPRHACQCNTRCSQYHNCCGDYADQCIIPETAEAGPGPHSCTVYGCVHYNKSYACQCNIHCNEYHNCCSDYHHNCAKSRSSKLSEKTQHKMVNESDSSTDNVTKAGKAEMENTEEEKHERSRRPGKRVRNKMATGEQESHTEKAETNETQK